MGKSLSCQRMAFSLGVGFLASTFVNGIMNGFQWEMNGGVAFDTHAPIGFLFLYLVVLIPILEELLFRGILFLGILKLSQGGKRSFWIGMLVNCVLFGSLHVGIAGKLFAAGFSVLLCLLAKRLGLPSAIWAHVGFNLTAFAFGQCDPPVALLLYGLGSLLIVLTLRMSKTEQERMKSWPRLTKMR